jgi:hypothetical protein
MREGASLAEVAPGRSRLLESGSARMLTSGSGLEASLVRTRPGDPPRRAAPRARLPVPGDGSRDTA